MEERLVPREIKKKFSGVRGKNIISGCYGIYNYWLYYNKIKPKTDKYKITWKEHSDIIHAVHRELKEEIFNTGSFDLPYNIGSLVLIKGADQFVKFKDGEVKIPHTYVIDWDRTHELWYNDEEAYANRTLIRFEVKNMYHIVFNKKHGSFKNQSYYKFRTVRNFKKDVAKRAKNNTLDNFFVRYG